MTKRPHINPWETRWVEVGANWETVARKAIEKMMEQMGVPSSFYEGQPIYTPRRMPTASLDALRPSPTSVEPCQGEGLPEGQ